MDNNNLSNLRIVAADDNGWGFVKDMLKDKDLADSIDYIGLVCPHASVAGCKLFSIPLLSLVTVESNQSLLSGRILD